MAIVRSREALVGCRTQLVNHVRGAVKSFGARLPKCPAVSFHKRAAEHIPEALWPALGPILEQIGSLTQRIRDPLGGLTTAVTRSRFSTCECRCKKGQRLAREATFDRAATLRPSFLLLFTRVRGKVNSANFM
jgi:hypothetical protein